VTQVQPGKMADLTVAVPETRQHDSLASMLRNRGAKVLPVPLVAIHDNPDEGQVLQWLQAFIGSPPDLLILLTGEGLRRLLALAERQHLQAAFVTALAQVRKLCRGPKPERALQEISLRADLTADVPTTEGVITTLSRENLRGKRVAVQLYGLEPNLRLTTFLQEAGACVDTVAPYVYASQEDEARVIDFIQALAEGKVDVLAFTSQSQFKRLQEVANNHSLQERLQQGMHRTVLAAVGPVVRDQLQHLGFNVAIMPERLYFMMPLVAAIERYFKHESE